MKVYLALDAPASAPTRIEDAVLQAERLGYEGVSLPELGHDPIPQLAVAARATTRIQLATGVLIAFARTPMTVAMSAADLQEASGGRFVLGLGSQVRAHIERRFSMPWSAPADRMRDFVHALRAIWTSFEDGSRLRHEGLFYSHTLLTPMFSPSGMPFGPPPVWIAGVGKGMTAVAGEVGDGYVAHAFSTPEYLRAVTCEALDRGAERGGRDRPLLVASPMVAIGRTAEELAPAREAVRAQLAFYASTPTYRPVMELHGWESVADRLSGMARRQLWQEMAAELDDEIVSAFAVIGDPEYVARELAARYDSLADVLSLGLPSSTDPELQQQLLAALQD